MRLNAYITTALAGALSLSTTALAGGKHHTKDFYARNLKTISSIYNLTVFPNNVPIITHGGSAVPKGLFSANASGRVSPLGNFTGFEDSIEYFFALALTPNAPSFSVFTSAKVVSFSSGCADVAASVAYLETRVLNPNSTDNGKYLSTLKQVAFWRFDKDGAVIAYDAWIPNLNIWNFLARGEADITNPFVQQAFIQRICPTIQGLCTGANQQYTDVPTCISSMTSKPFGNYDEVWGDNVACRTIHLILAGVRPDAHCPHVGPDGGMKCVNEPYNHGYFDDEDLFGAPTGKTFVCPDKEEEHDPYGRVELV
ncbi:hypothetical protein IFR05_005406 [Cadophora sp. M221]|nr:hypothetical protein IFR05_005406 [Cadophora sp. M221]